jgi:galactose oxidase
MISPQTPFRSRLRIQAHALAVAALLGCQEATPPESPAGEAARVTARYVCGDNFEIGNGNPAAVTAHFEVAASGESGDLLLPAGAADDTPSLTRLTTRTGGAVRVSVEGTPAADADNTGGSCPRPDPPLPEPQASIGEWSPPFDWPVVAVHLHLLPDGRVLSWGMIGDPQVWNPSTGEFTALPVPSNVFCGGHTFLSDGRLLVAGGHISEDHGIPATTLFDFTTNSWTSAPPMARGRWYPTTTELSDGRVLVLGGADENGLQVPVPEIWDGTTWNPLSAADRVLPYYPRTFVAPNGQVFYADEGKQSYYLDPSSGAWTEVAQTLYGDREYGSAIMYRPGKVLIVGGSSTPSGSPTNSAEVIDLTDAVPAWRFTGSMASARRQLNVTGLPDGRVVVTGGTSSSGFTDPAGAVHAADAWDPSSGTWNTWASNAVTRVYHSSTILLPDGRLLHAGSGDGGNIPRELNAELFSPPYLFHGPRPTIGSAPDVVGYGERFEVATTDAGIITQATWIRLSSVTHSFDQNQRFVPLDVVRTAGGLTIMAPAGPNVAPPGPYMLFLLNGDGVPSIARIMRVR